MNVRCCHKTKCSFAKAASILIAVILTVSLIPFAGGNTTQAEAAVEMQKRTGTLAVNSTTIAFGGYEWWVIGDETNGVYPKAGSVTLFAKDDDFGNTAFKVDGSSQDYSGSDLQTKMTDVANGINNQERSLINPRTITTSDDADENLATEVTNQLLWPISSDEWDKIASSTVCGFANWYWMRSPYGVFSARAGNPDGIRLGRGDVTTSGNSVRPALSLSLSSVLFTSSASATSGKSSAPTDGTLAATQVPTDTIKLTVEDDGLDLASVTINSSAGRDVVIGYTGATGGATLSAIMADSSGEVSHYGKLTAVDLSGEGEAVLTVPGAYDPASHSIYVFVEELNGDSYTDFASTPVPLELKQSEPSGLATTPASSATSADGTITGTSTALEYKLASSSTWTDAGGTSITGLTSGTYEVRTKAIDVVEASDAVTLTVAARPNVASIAPTGTSVPVTTTDLVITFDTAMNASTGTVSINGTPITTAPSWTAGETIATYSLPALDYASDYTVNISDFESASNVAMTAYEGYTFTTEAATTGEKNTSNTSVSGAVAKTGDRTPIVLIVLAGFGAFAALALSRAFGLRKAVQAKHWK